MSAMLFRCCHVNTFFNFVFTRKMPLQQSIAGLSGGLDTFYSNSLTIFNVVKLGPFELHVLGFVYMLLQAYESVHF